MKLLCKLFGHKIVNPKKVVIVDPQTGEKGYTKYCDRCTYSEFIGTGVYDTKKVVKIISDRLDGIVTLLQSELKNNKTKLGLITDEVNELKQMLKERF